MMTAVVVLIVVIIIMIAAIIVLIADFFEIFVICVVSYSSQDGPSFALAEAFTGRRFRFSMQAG